MKLPARSPNLNAYAERFVRTIKESCLERLILFGEGSVRRAAAEFTVHYHHERNHQGLDNKLICPDPELVREGGEVKRRERLGGIAELLLQNSCVTTGGSNPDNRAGASAPVCVRYPVRPVLPSGPTEERTRTGRRVGRQGHCMVSEAAKTPIRGTCYPLGHISGYYGVRAASSPKYRRRRFPLRISEAEPHPLDDHCRG